MSSQDLDYYKVLGVERTATATEIRRAYLQQSRQWHPDKAQQNGITDENATSQFQLISSANEILADPRSRRIYDTRREQWADRRQAQEFDGFANFFNFGFRGDGSSSWFNQGRTQSDFRYAGSTSGGRSQYGASTAGPKTAKEIWKAFVCGNIPEHEFSKLIRHYSFTSFESDPSDFYEVFDKLFNKVVFAAEGVNASADFSTPPDFGTSETPWKSGPGPFYSYWSKFRTIQNLGSSSNSTATRSATKSSSSSGSKQAHRSQAKKQQKAAHELYNGKVHTLVDLLQCLDPRVKAEERRLDKRAEQQHVENVAKLSAERERIDAERAARCRSQEEEGIDVDNSESEEDFTGSACVFVVAPDGLVMTCKQAKEAAAQIAAVQVESGVVEGDGQDGVARMEQEEVQEQRGDVASDDASETTESSEESEPEVYQCEACRKIFKHVNQFESHCASKKHKKELAAFLERARNK